MPLKELCKFITPLACMAMLGCQEGSADHLGANAYWRPALLDGLSLMNADERGELENAVASPELRSTSTAPMSEEMLVGAILDSRGVFVKRRERYRLINKPVDQSLELRRFHAPGATMIFLSEDGASVAVRTYSDQPDLRVWTRAGMQVSPLRNGDIIAGKFNKSGEFLFATRASNQHIRINIYEDGVVRQLPPLFVGSYRAAFGCRISGHAQLLPVAILGEGNPHVAFFSDAGLSTDRVIEGSITPDCIASVDPRGVAAVLWTGEPHEEASPGSATQIRAAGENHLSQARDYETGRVLYRALYVKGSSYSSSFEPMIWEERSGVVSPELFYKNGIGPLNGGGRIEPVGKFSYVLVAADGVIKFSDEKSCFLSKSGVGVGGLYVRNGNYLAFYDEGKGDVVVVDIRGCGAA